MRVIRSLDELKQPLANLVLTIGNFDGMHRAHQRIVGRVVEKARAQKGTAAALTFEPHPAAVVSPGQAPPRLTTLEQKIRLLEAAGLDALLVLPFTHELSQYSPRRFVEEIICRRLSTRALYVGENFRFGHRQAGDVAVLRELAREFGFEVEIVRRVVVRGKTVSSTLIRHLVGEGNVAQVARLLGRPYALTGAIQKGHGRGRPLGFPTLNIKPEQESLPARGVYATETLLEGKTYASATNVGVNPTFDGDRLVVESYLLDFSQTIAQGRLEVLFYERLRPEKKFPSPKALQAEMERDVERTRRFFERLRQSRGRRRARPALR